jgi:hypothetical protein
MKKQDNQSTTRSLAVDSASAGSSQPETETELLKMAVFWMHKVNEYEPPRYLDMSWLSRCASYIEERMNEKNAEESRASSH